MKKTLLTLTASVAFAGAAVAQSSIAAWDFSQYAVDSFSSTDGLTLTGSLSANYTGGFPDFTGAPAFGTLYYDGTNGSTAFDLSASEVSPQSTLNTVVGDQAYLGVFGNRLVLDSQGQSNTQPNTFGLEVNGAFTFEITPGAPTDFTTLDYASFNSNDPSATLTWDYSTNGGGAWNPLGADTINTTETAFSVDLSAITGVSSVLLRGTLSGFDTNVFALDNVEVNGTIIPEPSSFAAIFGAVALGFAAVGRRRK